MRLQTRVQPIQRDLQLLLADDVKGTAASSALAQFARDEIADAVTINQQALGYQPVYEVFVDGVRGASLESVKPSGTIVADFKLVDNVLEWIRAQLETHSPVKGGRYRKSHVLFADNNEISRGARIPPAEEYVFVSTVPYARKIERGASPQAPEGVYQVVAVLAQRQFRNVASITFSYRTAILGEIVGGRIGNRSERRNPAIVVRPK
jgi:hypothetical protein